MKVNFIIHLGVSSSINFFHGVFGCRVLKQNGNTWVIGLAENEYASLLLRKECGSLRCTITPAEEAGPVSFQGEIRRIAAKNGYLHFECFIENAFEINRKSKQEVPCVLS